MSSQNNFDLIHSLVSYGQHIYNEYEIPYRWQEVVELIETDPEIFNACLRRVKSYKLPSNAPKSHKLWISCNLASGYKARIDCYFCGKLMTREDFLTGSIHLEHFNPRSQNGEHTPANIALACRSCNLLKSNYQESDFDQLINDPDLFRKKHPYTSTERFNQLIDFSEIIIARYKGNNWFIKRHELSSQNWRKVWDDLKTEYRRKWMDM